MFCAKCGNQTPDDSNFCRGCGHAVADSNSSGAAAEVAPACVRAKLKHKALWILLPIGLVIYWVSTHSTHSQPSQPSQRAAKQEQIHTISNRALIVKATGNSHFKLDVPAGADSVYLRGNFTARGGMDDDIEARVFSDDEFMNWQNGQSAETLYSSGKVTVGKFDINLPSGSGTYYLVFDNTSSLFTQKSVRLNATLSYYQ